MPACCGGAARTRFICGFLGCDERPFNPVLAALPRRLHLRGAPQQRRTLEALVAQAGTSRSVLAERFKRFIGQPPARYLMQWRMQLAARRLAEPGAKVAAVAAAVGYDSEAAFSRALKKCTGRSPAHWRKGAAAA